MFKATEMQLGVSRLMMPAVPCIDITEANAKVLPDERILVQLTGKKACAVFKVT